MEFTNIARERFAKDLFAAEATGIVIEKAAKDYARCSLELCEHHMNANGVCMGGVLFTLADFAFAVASNTDNPATVTVTSQINFLASPKGSRLTAETVCRKSGRTSAVFDVDIYDELGTLVAVVSATGLRRG